MTQILKPNEPQRQALKSLRSYRRKSNKALVVLPSGIGKTQLAVFDSKSAKSVLYIVHRKEILDQAVAAFKATRNLRDSQIGRITTGSRDFGKQFTFATIQTISRPKTLEQLSKYHFDYAIVDEYHHVAAKSYVSTLDQLHYGFLLGLTATPYRLDGKNILEFVDNNLVYEMDLEQGIEQKELVPFFYNGFADNVDYSDIKWQGHKYRERDLNKKLLIPERDKLIIDKYHEFISPNKQTVGFCATVPHVERMVSLFNSHGITAVGITHKTDRLTRMEAIEGFRAKEFQVLFTRDILNEGVDFPFVEALLFLRPTESKTVFFQQLGRGLRLAPGKHSVMVLDFVGNDHNSYKIPEWLGFAQKSTRPITEREHEDKPTYDYQPKSRIFFEHRVIEIFDKQKRMARQMTPPTKEEMIEDYWHVERIRGRQPNARDFKDTSRVSKYAFDWIQRVFGNWINYVVAAGASPRRQIRSNQEIEADWLSLKAKKNGRRPRIHELKPLSMSLIRKRYGSYTKFLWHMGETGIHCQHPPDVHCDDCGSATTAGGRWLKKYKDRDDKWRCGKCDKTAKRRAKGIFPRIQAPSNVCCYECGLTKSGRGFYFDVENRKWKCISCYQKLRYWKKRDQLKK